MIYRILLAALVTGSVYAQNQPIIKDSSTEWKCLRYENDPYKTRYFTLNNGFTVIVSPDQSTPRFYSCVAVRVGGKDDPANNTGLAHYLEHMLFKGTDQMGTSDYAKESDLLEYIDRLYDKYNSLKSNELRKKLYKVIDSVSLEASKYAIANEYDKLMQQMGVTGTNAFTGYDQTVYINDVPSVQLDNWMKVEFERFRKPVLRLFHTELEAVYEEKNISLDDDGYKAYEAVMSRLFKKHTYGTQTVIGKIEHLKNPSLKEIRKYYAANYIPAKMALIIAGNVDPVQVANLAAKSFGTLDVKEVQSKEIVKEDDFKNNEEVTLFGQESPFVTIGFRLPSAYNTGLGEQLYLIEQILGNDQVGMIKKNLLIPQKLLSADASIDRLHDYSVLFLSGKPLEGQSLEDVKKLLLDQIDSLHQKLQNPELILSIASNLELRRMEETESNHSRAFRLLDAYLYGESPETAFNVIERMKSIKPIALNVFVKKYIKENYVVVYKKQGNDSTIQKIEKPSISAINLNRDKTSRFAKDILDNEVEAQIPHFVDINRDIIKTELQKGGIPLYLVKNKDNKRFTLEYVIDKGRWDDNSLPMVLRYLQLAGSEKYDMNYLNSEFFKLACSVSFSVGDFQTRISLSGSADYFERAVSVLEYLLNNPAANQEVMDKLKLTILQERENQLSDRNSLQSALNYYALYGRKNPFNAVMTKKQLKEMKLKEFVERSKKLMNYPHKIYYYGPADYITLSNVINKYHHVDLTSNKVASKIKYVAPIMKDDQVFFYPYKMLQADIGWAGSVSNFNFDSTASVSLFNEYFGGSMASIVFQTIREARALAYSCYGYYRIPESIKKPAYFGAYVGTQSDKADSAIWVMHQLMKDMPMLNSQFEIARNSKIGQIQSNWIRRPDLINFAITIENRGLQNDPRENELKQIQQLTLQDIKNFHQKNIANKKFAMYVLADPAKLNPQSLKGYGKVKVLHQKELFGY